MNFILSQLFVFYLDSFTDAFPWFCRFFASNDDSVKRSIHPQILICCYLSFLFPCPVYRWYRGEVDCYASPIETSIQLGSHCNWGLWRWWQRDWLLSLSCSLSILSLFLSIFIPWRPCLSSSPFIHSVSVLFRFLGRQRWSCQNWGSQDGSCLACSHRWLRIERLSICSVRCHCRHNRGLRQSIQHATSGSPK